MFIQTLSVYCSNERNKQKQNKMKTQDQIITELTELNNNYSNGSLKVSRAKYMRMYNAIKNSNSLSNQIKDFGAKTKKEFAGYYIYEGVNFTANFNEEECETIWWQVSLYNDKVDPRVFEEFEDYNRFDRKCDVLQMLFEFDKRLSKNN